MANEEKVDPVVRTAVSVTKAGSRTISATALKAEAKKTSRHTHKAPVNPHAKESAKGEG